MRWRTRSGSIANRTGADALLKALLDGGEKVHLVERAGDVRWGHRQTCDMSAAMREAM